MLRSIQSMACATLLCTLCATSVAADAGGDTAAVELPPVITVAARTAGTFADAPVPASVVTSRDIRKMGASTVGDVLAEQTGLTVIQDHGVGVQMQGLSPDYTLILVDGEPAVGRTAGTLDLARFKVGGLEQVEIVQGPSSSLYGSDALGGVVNIVTRKPIDPFSVSFNSRYGTNNSLETGGTMEAKTGNTGFSVFADRSASDGYDLDPERRGKSAPPYSNYTVQPKVVHDWSENSRLTIAPRFFREDQENSVNFLSEGDTTYARERSTRDDWGLSATVEQ
ncbi:MAG TPA: TonB-dependent receptor plug domain-containing protein, partial [Fibrobacteria bacterium]|nr:TonB-dependent receptor plug domain-containing protein [Fibrobacteria bacterium]